MAYSLMGVVFGSTYSSVLRYSLKLRIQPFFNDKLGNNYNKIMVWIANQFCGLRLKIVILVFTLNS